MQSRISPDNWQKVSGLGIYESILNRAVPDSSTVPKYPQVSLVKILGVGCYFRDCEIRTRKVANSLENLQMCSKSCKYALNVCKYAWKVENGRYGRWFDPLNGVTAKNPWKISFNSLLSDKWHISCKAGVKY